MIMVETELPCRDHGKSHTLHILILTVKFIIFFLFQWTCTKFLWNIDRLDLHVVSFTCQKSRKRIVNICTYHVSQNEIKIQR